MGGAVLGWDELLYHVGVYSFFHTVFGLALKKWRKLMASLRDTWIGTRAHIAHHFEELTILVLATAAASI